MGNPLRRHERAPRPSACSSRVHLGHRLARGELAGRGGCSSRRRTRLESSLSPFCLPSSTCHPHLLEASGATSHSPLPASCPGSESRPSHPPVDHGVAPQSHAVRTQGHASQSKLFLFLFLAPRAETHRLNPASDARGPRRSCLGPSPAGEQPGHRPAFMALRVLRPLPLPAKPLCPPAGGGALLGSARSPRPCGAAHASAGQPVSPAHAPHGARPRPAQHRTLLCLMLSVSPAGVRDSQGKKPNLTDLLPEPSHNAGHVTGR